jgi:hypothetical protein
MFILAFSPLSYVPVVQLGEVILPVFAAWWPIMIFVPLFENAGMGLFFCFPTKTSFYGSCRIGILFLLYVLLLLVGYASLFFITHMDVRTLWLQTVIQSFFFCSLGYLSVVLSKRSGISIVIVALYSLAFLVAEKLMPHSYSVYARNVEPLSVEELCTHILPPALRMSIAFFILAHLCLIKRRE